MPAKTPPDRHRPMSRRAAHRRIRLFLHTRDDGSGCRRNSRRPLYGHVRHGPFSDGRELSRVSAIPAARARADARAKMKAARPALRPRPVAGTQSRAPQLLHRPARLGAARPLRVDRNWHALLPLEDHQRRVDTAALFIELDVVPGEVLGRALARVHGPDCLGDLAAIGKTRLFDRFFEDPHVTIRAQAVLGEPRLTGALLELVDELTLTLVAPIGDGDQDAFEHVGARDLEQLGGAKMRAVADDRQPAGADAHLSELLHE